MTTYTKILLLTLFSLTYSFLFSQTPNYEQKELLVKWKTSTTSTQKLNFRTEIKANRVKSFSNLDIEVWRVSEEQNLTITELIKAYYNHPSIEFIEYNHIYTIDQLFPNDPTFDDLWGLHNTGQNNGSFDADIDAPEGWALKNKSSTIKVAIIDTGIDWRHPDLVDNIWQNLGEDANGDGSVLKWDGNNWIFDPGDVNGIDDDGNGYADDFVGWDFRNNDNNPYDGNLHGTHVAGTIGAKGDNGIGAVGVTWDVQMAALKFLSDSGRGRLSDAIEAINYAVTVGMHISNNSWGGGIYSNALYEAIQLAGTQNHLFIAAAGNNFGNNNDLIPNYPSSYDLENIIAVAATDQNDQLSNFSNFGATTVDLAAPGSGIHSSTPNNSYKTISGTSMATPFVSGACAILWDLYPNKTYSEIKAELLATVDPLPALTTITGSGGRLNLCKLLGGCANEIPCIATDKVALATLYNATDGSNWTTNWDLDLPVTNWFGITTNDSGCVTEINLPNNNLVGNIPIEIGNLSSLEFLYLNDNELKEALPATIGNLITLQRVSLHNNQLGGLLPESLGNLDNLQRLSLNHNQFTGSIPDTLGGLGALEQLFLQNNELSGCFSSALTSLCAITYNFANNTDLPNGGDFAAFCANEAGSCNDCSIRDSIALRDLYTATNGANWTNPWDLDMPISTWYNVTTNNDGCVLSLKLQNNNLVGTIPATLEDLRQLEELYLYDNQLTGTIPSSIGNITTLKELHLAENQLMGSIPASFSNLIKLKNLNLYRNQLTGMIPATLGNLDSLQGLSLQHNQLTGSIPAELGEMKELVVLTLNNNQLEGIIPPVIGSLSKLQSIFLQNNQLVGTIPVAFENLTELVLLNLQNNQLTGSIPEQLGNLDKLQLLYLNENQLSGCFAEGLSTFCTIVYDFSSNLNLPNGGDFAAFCADGIGNCSEPVWPGDFNNDGFANITDVLFWGSACLNTMGPTRPDASTHWHAQTSPDWSFSVDNVNNKHQDADGNGTINTEDLSVLIETNMGKEHPTSATSFSASGITDGNGYRLEPKGYIAAGTLKYELYLEDSEGAPISAHGAACSINFNGLPIMGVEFDTTGSSLKPQIVVDTFYAEEGILDIALTRTDKTNQLTDGLLGVLIVIIDHYISENGDPILLSVENGSKLVANGGLSPVASTSVYANYSEIGVSSSHFELSVSVSPEQCGMLGSAAVFIDGGTGDFDIQWSNGATTEKITDLQAGIYTVTVTSQVTSQRVTYEVEIEGQFLPIYDDNGELVSCDIVACPTTLLLNNALTTSSHQAAASITSTAIIAAESSVIFTAGESITLQPGFSVTAGSEFVAKITDCAAIVPLVNTNYPSNSFFAVPIESINRSIIPTELAIQVAPNPLKNYALLTFDLPESGHVSLTLSNLQGAVTKVLLDGSYKEAGAHQFEFYTDGFAKGMYLLNLTTAHKKLSKKIVLLE